MIYTEIYKAMDSALDAQDFDLIDIDVDYQLLDHDLDVDIDKLLLENQKERNDRKTA
jgi:hypothetical protein